MTLPEIIAQLANCIILIAFGRFIVWHYSVTVGADPKTRRKK